ncbi:MAG: hypothetical protein KY445_12630 [Armatimonadetes bacterium]|nr:hypothetical protein [Armatimonadota bacterium]
MKPQPQLDLSLVRTYSVHERENKVETAAFGRTVPPDASFAAFFGSLPDILAGRELRAVVAAIVAAKKGEKRVLMTMGAHVIKVGLSPLLIDWMARGVLDGLALNGAGAVHDSEVARFGSTSEDVGAGIQSGLFGMARETGEFINGAAQIAQKNGHGFGETLGAALIQENAPFGELSLLAAGQKYGVPVTVHVAIGSDIPHPQPSMDGAATGAATFNDFKIWANCVKDLSGGVLLNVGSAVLLPTIIEKSLAVTRNLGHDVRDFTGVNFDFIQSYRSNWNPVRRANELSDGAGRGISITGHHELTIPLLVAAVNQQLATEDTQRGTEEFI